jgi:hypothetical protein
MFSQLATSTTDSGFVPVRDRKILQERDLAIKKLASSLINMGLDKEDIKSLYRIVERSPRGI